MNPQKKSDRDLGQGGFTLIEIVLAVALSAMLLTAVYWTYFNINRSIDAAEENQEALETGRMLTEMIRKDIRGIVSDRFSLSAKNQTVDGRVLGQVEFVTTAGFHADPLKLRRIGYELVVNDKGDKVFVRKESTDLADPLDRTSTRVFELSRIVRGFHLQFYNGTDWTEAWDSGASGALPKQIRVIFDVSDSKGRDKRFSAEESVQSAIQ
jgi:general secretion pathway protein J